MQAPDTEEVLSGQGTAGDVMRGTGHYPPGGMLSQGLLHVQQGKDVPPAWLTCSQSALHGFSGETRRQGSGRKPSHRISKARLAYESALISHTLSREFPFSSTHLNLD